jgi:cytosine/adenosine deaminase-related metal-dependent hydrolase
MIIRAKYALLSPGEVRRDVCLEVDGERIAAVHSGYRPGAMRPDHDFGLAVITPGLVNPHTHLELEYCAGDAPFRGSFTDWLQRIRDSKRSRGDQATALPVASLRHLASCGCTTVLDHYTTELDWAGIERSGLRYLPLREFFQFNNHAPDPAQMRKQSHGGFAPHAPYTASIEIAQACRRLADEAGLPLSMHVSEVPAELEFVRTGQNEEIHRLLELAGAVDPEWRGTGLSPVQYYARHGIFDGPAYAVHVNYCLDGDLDVLAALKPTVVFCPRSHAYFGHPPHPIAEYLAAGIPLALGTDSLASNTQLSPLHEAALVRLRYPQVTAAQIFAAMTLAALAPLGWDGYLGKLEPGYLADFAVFRLDGDPGGVLGRDELFAALLDAVIATNHAVHTAVGGMPLFEAQPAALHAN